MKYLAIIEVDYAEEPRPTTHELRKTLEEPTMVPDATVRVVSLGELN